MLIRVAEVRDLEAIVEIHNQAVATRSTGFTDPLEPAGRLAWLRSHTDRRPLVVAEIDNDVAGWANLGDYRSGRGAFRGTAEISYYVHARHRRQGVASALVTHLIQRCPDLEISALVAILLADNAPSIALLTKFGFREWGRLPGVAVIDGVAGDHVYYGRQLG